MADRLQTRPRNSKESPVLRRLTRAEFNAIKATGVVPYKNAVAILIVPPLNRNPKTKMRPKPSIALTDEEPVEKPPLRPAPPLSTLHPSDATNSDDCDNPSRAQVPLYHGITLFPNRSQRAALHASLSHLLFVERARYRKHGQLPATSPPENSTDRRSRGDQKGSHAFLLCSDAGTSLRTDAAAVAIALWRVRMWEGGGWEEGGEHAAGWLQVNSRH
jgi:hypothetical protein